MINKLLQQYLESIAKQYQPTPPTNEAEIILHHIIATIQKHPQFYKCVKTASNFLIYNNKALTAILFAGNYPIIVISTPSLRTRKYNTVEPNSIETIIELIETGLKLTN